MKKHRWEEVPVTQAIRRFRRNQPQIYRIMVTGYLDSEWSERLGGLQIDSLAESDHDHPVTVLQGLISDQAQLSGILNTLSDLRLSLVSVELMESDSKQ